MRRTLTTQMTLASLALGGVVVAIVFVLLLMAEAQQSRTERVRQAGDRVLAATEVRAIVVDLQAGQRGFLLTRDERFLEPYDAALRRWRSPAGRRLVAGLGAPGGLVRRRIDSLIDEYLAITIRLVARDPVRVRFMVRSGLGKRRVDVLRRQLGTLIAAARADRLVALDELRQADRRATAAAAAGLLLATLLVALFTVYLVRAVVRPVRRVAAAARSMSAGDLDARVAPIARPARELDEMAVAFNQMATDLEARTSELESRYEEIRLEVGRAATLQRQLLPDRPPDAARMELAGACLPAADVGGDYFDFLVDRQGRVTLLVADVAGHGIASALLMAMVRQVARREVLAGSPPGTVLSVANRDLYDDLVTVELFVTVFCARVDLAGGRVEFANAGHNRPLLRRADGTLEELDADGMAIGLVDDVAFEDAARPFGPGDSLVLYTDGVVEAEDAGGAALGDAALRALVTGLGGAPPEVTVARVVGAVREHVGARPVRDDVTVVAARHPGATRDPRPGGRG
jgi:serine phosphatase RsbU (regulator of sigma subunit)